MSHGGGGGDADDEIPENHPHGLPHWFVSFADLMSLLMSFFVLMLSFSQQDGAKYKKVAGSMDKAYGVQRAVPVMEIPKGTSIVAQEFSPGKPEPTPLKEIYQKSIDDYRQTLDFDKGRGGEQGGGTGTIASSSSDIKDVPSNVTGKGTKDISEEIAYQLASELSKELRKGNIEIEVSGSRVTIRLMEEGSFESGEANLQPDAFSALDKIRKMLSKTPGLITVAGHTDDLPINTHHYRSNWELSAARAVSVVHGLMMYNVIAPNRISVMGYGDTHPLFANNTAENRRHNRRVEIIIEQGQTPSYLDVSVNSQPETAKEEGIENTKELLEKNNPDKLYQQLMPRQPATLFPITNNPGAKK